MTVLDGHPAIEAVAQAIYLWPDAADQQSWEELPDRYKDVWRSKAKAAIVAQEATEDRYFKAAYRALLGQRWTKQQADYLITIVQQGRMA